MARRARRWLACGARGSSGRAAVRSPADPGPHRHGGHVVAFWKYVEPAARGRADGGGARRSRAIHEALADYAGPSCRLFTPPTLVDDHSIVWSPPPTPSSCASSACGSSPVLPRRSTATRISRTACPGRSGTTSRRRAAGRASSTSPRCALSARVSGDEPSRIALEAYGDHDADLMEQCLPVYAAWIYASFMVALPRRPELGPLLGSASLAARRIRLRLKIGVPRFELGTSPTRTERATRLRHTPRTAP